MENNMKEQETKGNKWTLVFYYPVGKKQLYAQIYDNVTEDVIEEDVITNQDDYDFAIEVFTLADANWSKNNLVVSN
jgi:hypothetical protein